MLKSRVLNILLGGALVAQAGLTVHQAVATSQVLSVGTAAQSAVALGQPTPDSAFLNCPWSEAERRSMQLEYVKATGHWEMRLNHQPLGVDGGLMALQNCPPLKR